jgi:hypothetical protein
MITTWATSQKNNNTVSDNITIYLACYPRIAAPPNSACPRPCEIHIYNTRPHNCLDGTFHVYNTQCRASNPGTPRATKESQGEEDTNNRTITKAPKQNKSKKSKPFKDLA